MRKTNKIDNTRKVVTNDSIVGVLKDKVLANAIRQGIEALVPTMTKKGGVAKNWSGTISQLDRALRRVISTRGINWPSSPSVMRRVINNVVYTLNRSGVKTTFSRTPDQMRKRIVEFVRR